MKKKPSLLDIELFVQKRTDEKRRELSKTEADSDAMVFDSIADPSVEAESVKRSSNSKTALLVNESVVTDSEATDTKEVASGSAEAIKIDESASEHDNKDVEPPQIAVVDERLIAIIEVTDQQRDEINRLKQDMFKLKEQLRVYHSFLSSQQKKISELEKSLSEKSISDEPANIGIVDANYAKLLLKNIVWLKEERDFSSNDVARLFRAEGFDTPLPYKHWDEKVINTMYADAKRSFL